MGGNFKRLYLTVGWKYYSHWCCREGNAVLVLSSSMTNIDIATASPVYLNFNFSSQLRDQAQRPWLVMVAAQNINLEDPDDTKIRALEKVTEGMGGGKVEVS